MNETPPTPSSHEKGSPKKKRHGAKTLGAVALLAGVTGTAQAENPEDAAQKLAENPQAVVYPAVEEIQENLATTFKHLGTELNTAVENFKEAVAEHGIDPMPQALSNMANTVQRTIDAIDTTDTRNQKTHAKLLILHTKITTLADLYTRHTNTLYVIAERFKDGFDEDVLGLGVSDATPEKLKKHIEKLTQKRASIASAIQEVNDSLSTTKDLGNLRLPENMLAGFDTILANLQKLLNKAQ
jgi:gas vesicle protein